MHLVDRLRSTGPVTDVASFTEHCRVRQRMRRSRDIHVAAGTRRGERLHWIERSLWIGYRIQTGQRQIVLLTAIDVAQGAVLRVRRRAGRTQRREQRAAEVVGATAETDHNVRPSGRLIDAVVNPVYQ